MNVYSSTQSPLPHLAGILIILRERVGLKGVSFLFHSCHFYGQYLKIDIFVLI